MRDRGRKMEYQAGQPPYIDMGRRRREGGRHKMGK